MKTGHHRIDLYCRPGLLRIECTCGWKWCRKEPGVKRPALDIPAHRAMREHLNLRGEARK